MLNKDYNNDITVDETVNSKKTTNSAFEFKEILGDLFTSSDSLANCVSEDFRMDKGIASIFKKQFGGDNELKSQNRRTGQVAYLKRPDLQRNPDRYIFYLVTKVFYYEKPNYINLKASLIDLRDQCIKLGVKRLSMPKIACGLDKLNWITVSEIIKDVFKDTDIQITIYGYE